MISVARGSMRSRWFCGGPRSSSWFCGSLILAEMSAAASSPSSSSFLPLALLARIGHLGVSWGPLDLAGSLHSPSSKTAPPGGYLRDFHADFFCRFRLMCRCLAAFLAAQIPADASLRRSAHAPGHLGEGGRRRSSSSSRGPNPSQSAMQALATLESLRSNKSYAEQRHLVEFCIGFITNPANCIRDASTMLHQMLQKLYPNVPYLAILYE